MSSRAAVAQIHIVNATKDGADSAFSSLFNNLSGISPDGFVAIDTEFSGLVSDPDLSHDDLTVRYAAIRRIADQRAIFSIGISVFRPIENTSGEPVNGIEASEAAIKPRLYEVSTYDFLMCCQDDFSTNANAGAFLVTHGFDFARMFKRGIPYSRASTEKVQEGAGGKDATKEGTSWRWGKLPRGLLWRIGRHGVPLVLHNGLFDLVFLFAALQGPLPPTLNGFIAALLECSPAGYWDSKVLADTAGDRASYLGYIFAKAVLQGRVTVRNASGMPSSEVTDPPEEEPLPFADDTLCALYAFRGFCPRGTACPFAHDPFLVLEEEKKGVLPKDSKAAYKKHKTQSKELKRHRSVAKENLSKVNKKQRRKLMRERQRQLEENGALQRDLQELNVVEGPPAPDAAKCHQEQTSNERKVHTAGWDAFCTGFVFATYRESIPQERLAKDRNRIAVAKRLSGLLLSKSPFADLDKAPADVTVGKKQAFRVS